VEFVHYVDKPTETKLMIVWTQKEKKGSSLMKDPKMTQHNAKSVRDSITGAQTNASLQAQNANEEFEKVSLGPNSRILKHL
jgi:hypothetical protein